MNDRPKVSVIIPVYNVEKYLRECLDSVLGQTLRDIEIICVDDGSTDSSLDILREYRAADNRVSIYTQKNRGAGAARNTGMQYATGEYLFFMDSDDYCKKDMFEKTTAYAAEKNADIVVFNYYRFNNADNSMEFRNGLVKSRYPSEKEVFSYRDIPDVICLTVNPTPWNKLYLHEYVKNTGLQWLEVSTTNDITFATMSVIMADRIAYLDEAFMYYRVAINNSITSKKKYNQDNVIKAVLSVAEQAEKLEYYQVIKNSVQEFVASNLFNALKSYTPDEDTAYHLAFEKKIDAIFFMHPLFLEFDKCKFKDKGLFRKMLESRTRAMLRKDFSYLPEVIVSFTSFPGRISTVYKTVASIYKQTRQPDRIILWLAESQFPGKEADLPEELLEFRMFGFEIRWCSEDIRPHKKYFYAMQEFPDALIITIDDDLTYDEQMIETLLTSYMHFPRAVSTVRTHLMTKNDRGQIDSYTNWVKEFSGVVGVPSMQLFSTSGAGTLYPPHCMDEEVFNIENIKALSLNADDLWLKVMQVRKGTPVVLCKPNKLLRYIPGTQDQALQNTNVHQNANDTQLQKILSVYDTDGKYSGIMLADNYERETKVKGFDLINNNQYGTLASQEKYVQVERNNHILKQELYHIKHSVSFKIGRIITYIPRKIRGGIQCYKDNGLGYTIHRIWEKSVALLNKL